MYILDINMCQKMRRPDKKKKETNRVGYLF